MATPFQTYKWRRLPFDLSVSSEIFQKCVQAALEDLPNVHVIAADDILICCNSKTLVDAMKSHDETMDAFLNCCLDMNIVLNPDKFVYKTQKIPFMGHILIDQGILPDPEKVHAFENMPYPESVSAVQHLNGCINYLSRYIPYLADLAKPLRDLTHKDVTFKWEAHRTEAVDQIKRALVSAPALAYFDINSPVTIQCDASNLVFGAYLPQHDHPVVYASWPLTEAEAHRSAMEKELLVVVYAMTKFHYLTYSRHVTVASDHKPLAAILKKPLSNAPQRLQPMIIERAPEI